MTGVSTFTQDIADIICERLADGESMRAICSEPGMPSKSTVCKWLGQFTAFSDQYARAREMQGDSLFDDCITIADDRTNDWVKIPGAKEGDELYRVNGEHIQRSRLRVDTRKWMAGKLQPKKYGEKVVNEHTGKDGESLFKDVVVTIVDPAKPRQL